MANLGETGMSARDVKGEGCIISEKLANDHFPISFAIISCILTWVGLWTFQVDVNP